MKLIIDIPDNVYIACNEYKDNTNIGILQRILYIAISNGIPLPKGHGDLIDRDECLKLKMTDLYDKDGVTMYAVPTGNILRIKPVIEADKGE